MGTWMEQVTAQSQCKKENSLNIYRWKYAKGIRDKSVEVPATFELQRTVITLDDGEGSGCQGSLSPRSKHIDIKRHYIRDHVFFKFDYCIFQELARLFLMPIIVMKG